MKPVPSSKFGSLTVHDDAVHEDVDPKTFTDGG
jgi:hypothetical protein